MSASSVSTNEQILEDQLTCPVLLEPLFEAVSLVPCAHKIQQAAAEKIFGSTDGGWSVQSNKTCPVCRVSILGYMVDHSTRNIVQQLSTLSENALHMVLATMKKSLSEKCMSVEKDILYMPYPGNPARFVYVGGNWHLDDPSANSIRFMAFKSATKDSWLKKFTLFGSRNDRFWFQLHFSENSINITEYFKQFDIVIDCFDQIHGYNSNGSDQLKIIFKIISENNEIPATHFNQIKDIVAKTTH